MWAYLDSQGTRHNHLSEQEVVALIRAKKIDQHSLLWRRGYHEWRSLKDTELAAYLPAETPPPELTQLAQQPASPTLAPPAGSASSSVTRSEAQLADVLGAAKNLPALAFYFACFQLGATALTFWIEGRMRSQIQTLEQWQELHSQSLQRLQNGEPNSLEILLKIVWAFQLIASIFFAFHWLRWQYRASKNAQVLKLPFRHHPLLSLFWWFLPLFQLFMPWVILGSLLNACPFSVSKNALTRGKKLWRFASLSWLGSLLLLIFVDRLNAGILNTSLYPNQTQSFAEQYPAIFELIHNAGLQSLNLLSLLKVALGLLSIACIFAATKLALAISGQQVRLAAKHLAQKQSQGSQNSTQQPKQES